MRGQTKQERPYSMRQVILQNFFYWMPSTHLIHEYMRDYAHVLKPEITGHGSGRRFFFKEENLKEFVRMFENGDVKDYLQSPKLLNALQVHKSGMIYWVSTYASVLNYMNKYEQILKPVRYANKAKGQKVYTTEANVKELVRLHEEGKLG